MDVNKYAVVFDTNSYRNLVRERSIPDIETYITELKEKQARKNIIAKATPVVAMELLSNLAGPGKSPHFEDCLKGLIAMANHCYEEPKNTMHLISHPYLNITINFFERTLPEVELKGRNMAGVIGDFKIDYLKALEGHEQKGTFSILKDYIDVEEARWISEVEGFINLARREVLKSDSDLTGKALRDKMLEFIDSGLFVPRMSMAIISGIAKSLKIEMIGDEHAYKGYMLPQIFPFAVAFYQWICHRVVMDGIDLQNPKSRATRWNWRWDYEVAFLMNNIPIDNRHVLIVTSDKEITRMVHNYGYGDRVMDLKQYFTFLET